MQPQPVEGLGVHIPIIATNGYNKRLTTMEAGEGTRGTILGMDQIKRICESTDQSTCCLNGTRPPKIA